MPNILEITYIPHKFCPEFTIDNLPDDIYPAISEYTGAELFAASEEYSAINIPEEYAKYLGCSSGDAVFKVERETTNTDKNVFEIRTLLALGKKNIITAYITREDVMISLKNEQ
ncbi:UTRA domain-containing protein [Lachnospiraceae bacterium ZAX-1]